MPMLYEDLLETHSLNHVLRIAREMHPASRGLGVEVKAPPKTPTSQPGKRLVHIAPRPASDDRETVMPPAFSPEDFDVPFGADHTSVTLPCTPLPEKEPKAP